MKRQPGIEFSGPFFTKDIQKTVGQNMRTMLEDMAREGQSAITSAMPRRTGRTAAGVRGRVASLSGRPWHLTAVISQTRIFPWPKGGPKQYRGGKLEARGHQFRRVGSALRRAVKADLTKGLN